MAFLGMRNAPAPISVAHEGSLSGTHQRSGTKQREGQARTPALCIDS